MDAFIKKEVPSQEEEYVWYEPYQGLPYYSDMDDVVDQENSEKAVDTYDRFVGAEVCLPGERGGVMARVTNHVKDNEGKPRKIENPALFADHSLYEVSFPNSRTKHLTANVIADKMLSQVD